MLSYSIVIFYLLFHWTNTNFGSLSRRQPQSPLKKNFMAHFYGWGSTVSNRPRDTQTDWHIGKLMNTKKWKSKKTNIVCCQCWSPRYRASVLSTKCGGCHPKGLIVASSYKIKQRIIIIIIGMRIGTGMPVLILSLIK